MNAPMTDERLVEIRSLSLRFTTGAVKAALIDLDAEVRRLRAALAARPEPIGYAATRLDKNGRVLVWDEAFSTPDEARSRAEGLRSATATFPVCALVPVPVGGTP